MSSTTTQLIGCNIRPGHTPGGFTHPIGRSRGRQKIYKPRQSLYAFANEFKEAANRMLDGARRPRP
jgi:hypothetical protein